MGSKTKRQNSFDNEQSNLKIVKNDIIIAKSKFYCTATLQLVIKTIYEYLKMLKEVRGKEEFAGSLIEYLLLYNDRSFLLIVKSEVVKKLQVLRKVTAAHMALSQLCLQLLLHLWPNIQKQILESCQLIQKYQVLEDIAEEDSYPRKGSAV